MLFARLADRDDPIDREAIADRFLPLARSLAARYVRHDEPFDDIFQVACIGLLKAIDGFDVTQGRAFSSYAVPTIPGEIKRYYRDRTWSVHVPRDLQELTLVVRRVVDEFERDNQRAATVGEHIGVDEPGYREAEARAQLARLLELLPPREQFVVRLRFERDLTQEQIGAFVGLSQIQISRVLRRSIAMLSAATIERSQSSTRARASPSHPGR